MQTGSLMTRLGARRWQIWTVDAHLLVTDPAALPEAAHIVDGLLTDVESAASRFRADSEVARLAADGAAGGSVSPMLAHLLEAALGAAADTDGDVDPTLGNALVQLGAPAGDGTSRLTLRQRIDWRSIRLDGRRLWMPRGVLLDLGATAKAVAADIAAEKIADQLGVGVLVGLGGDLRVAGEQAPEEGWIIRIQDGPNEPSTSVRLTGVTALATSSTLHRAWQHDGRRLHHILDPATCQPASAVWRTATVGARSCLRANTLSTACLVRGNRAPSLISREGLPARLVAADGKVHTFGGFPA